MSKDVNSSLKWLRIGCASCVLCSSKIWKRIFKILISRVLFKGRYILLFFCKSRPGFFYIFCTGRWTRIPNLKKYTGWCVSYDHRKIEPKRFNTRYLSNNVNPIKYGFLEPPQHPLYPVYCFSVGTSKHCSCLHHFGAATFKHWPGSCEFKSRPNRRGILIFSFK